ncbi:MAG: hypothetical protein LKJ48_00285 [Lactobacillus sp.]|jgi:alpha-galactosidase|nr:hypothetical protein [Lactobacillus sp.]
MITPDYIQIQTKDDSWEQLDHVCKNVWNGSAKVLIESVGNDEVTVSVAATETAIKRIHLTWNKQFKQNTVYSGDQFERSYGDMHFSTLDPDRRMQWYFLANNDAQIEGWGLRIGPTALGYWQVNTNAVDLWLDVRNGTQALQLTNRELECATVVWMKGNHYENCFAFAREFCERLAIGSRHVQTPRLYGANDWYYAYGHNTAKSVEALSSYIATVTDGMTNRPFMVIDDGWEQEWSDTYNGGPWKQSNTDFDGMAKIAEIIKAMDVRPGIWFRPLLTRRSAVTDVDMILRDYDSESVVLDPSHPKVLELVAADVRRIKRWGFELIKHDFSTVDIFGANGFEMVSDYFAFDTSFYDSTKTTAEIITTFYKTIQAAAGDTIVTGCNTVSHLAAGIFAAQRIGDDTSGVNFARTRQMGVNSLAFRLPQNNIFYTCDADCVGITENIPWRDNQQWLHLLAQSATPLFVSCDPLKMTDTITEELKAAFELVNSPDTTAIPIDWEYNVYPERWQTNSGEQHFDWYERPRLAESPAKPFTI